MDDKKVGHRGEVWYQPAPVHFDCAWPRWSKFLFCAVLLVVALMVDKTVALAAYAHPITFQSDINLEMIMLMQWGQWTCSVLVILAVVLLDQQGRRKAMAMAVGCLAAVAVCYLLKGFCGRARPWLLHEAVFGFFGPAYGFLRGATYQSFPSAHASGAFALAAALSWFYPKGRALFYGLALDTAFQRVIRHDHFPADVVAGAAIAVTVVRSVLWWNWPGKLIAVLPRTWQDWLLANP